MTVLRATLSVTSDDPETITWAVESMTRTATGIALEGVEAVVVIAPDDEDEDDVALDEYDDPDSEEP